MNESPKVEKSRRDGIERKFKKGGKNAKRTVDQISYNM